MKFKIGDKVKVKSLDWYNQNKDEYGDVWEGYTAFESIMSEYCGKVLTIEVVHIGCYNLEEDSYNYDWEDWMFEEEKIN